MIFELDLKNVSNLEDKNFLGFKDLVSTWYNEAIEELYQDISRSKYCNLYFLKNENEEVVGGLIISDIHLRDYTDVSKEVQKTLQKLSTNEYSYLMWLYLKEDLRGSGLGGSLVNPYFLFLENII